jgi:hypothetical protein
MAQKKQKEIGLVFSGLNNFGLTFRTGTKKSMWRLNTLFISGNNTDKVSDSIKSKQSNSGFGVDIGREYRKEITKDFELRFGADLSFRYNKSKSNYESIRVNYEIRSNEETIYTPGLNLVFGVNYEISHNLVLGAELLPSINYAFGTSIDKGSYYYKNTNHEIKSDISGLSYGLSNTSILLSLAYRFK